MKRISICASPCSPWCFASLRNGVWARVRTPAIRFRDSERKDVDFPKPCLSRRSLVTLQIAASIVLLSGAALLLRSFEKIEQQSLGMQTGGVVTVKVALPWFRYNSPQKSMEFYLNLESALQRLPGNRAVGITDSIHREGGRATFVMLIFRYKVDRPRLRAREGRLRAGGLPRTIFARSISPSSTAATLPIRIGMEVSRNVSSAGCSRPGCFRVKIRSESGLRIVSQGLRS